MNELAPPYLCELFRKRDTIQVRNTRNRHSLHIPLCKTKLQTANFSFIEQLVYGITDRRRIKAAILKSFQN